MATGEELADQSAEWTRRWTERYHELIEFLVANGSMPKESGTNSSSEARLGGWVRYQRRRAARGIMPDWQFALLAASPQLSWSPANESWELRLGRLQAFLDTEGRVPRYRSAIPEERALAAWVHGCISSDTSIGEGSFRPIA